MNSRAAWATQRERKGWGGEMREEKGGGGGLEGERMGKKGREETNTMLKLCLGSLAFPIYPHFPLFWTDVPG
jgi:hypothetical protein